MPGRRHRPKYTILKVEAIPDQGGSRQWGGKKGECSRSGMDLSDRATLKYLIDCGVHKPPTLLSCYLHGTVVMRCVILGGIIAIYRELIVV